MNKDIYKIDGEKIEFHQDRVKQWLEAGKDWEKAKKIYPIYIEFSPAGACNHRCTFCAVDYIGYKTRFLETDILKERLIEMGELGVKSIMYAGEGEPLLHKNLADIIIHTKESGIDVAITTNATPMNEKFLRQSLPSITWIKASINSGRVETYARVHKTKADHFQLAWHNMALASKIREEMRLNPLEHSLGAQMVLLPENACEVVDFAKMAKNNGLDYAVIKPYSQHNLSLTRQYEGTRYEETLKLEDELLSLNTDTFKVIFRSVAMKELNNPVHEYDKCQSTPFFWAYVMANGDVYGCSAYLEDRRFCYGNLMKESFKEIWEGEKRKENMRFVWNGLNISECRRNCRMDKVNKRLYHLTLTPDPIRSLEQARSSVDYNPHRNFI